MKKGQAEAQERERRGDSARRGIAAHPAASPATSAAGGVGAAAASTRERGGAEAAQEG